MNRDFFIFIFFFFFFTTLYCIGNIFINILQLRVFALDAQYSLNKVHVVSLSVFMKNFPYRYSTLVEVN